MIVRGTVMTICNDEFTSSGGPGVALGRTVCTGQAARQETIIATVPTDVAIQSVAWTKEYARTT